MGNLLGKIPLAYHAWHLPNYSGSKKVEEVFETLQWKFLESHETKYGPL